MDDAERLRRIGKRAVQMVEVGFVVGLGTGSTVDAMIPWLGKRVREGLEFSGVATSEHTKALARKHSIPLLDLNDVQGLNLCIDGADEIDPDLNLVKGRGGALLYEKLVAEQAEGFVVIASAEKLVDQLGMRLPLPVEVVPFGHSHTQRAVDALGLESTLRLTGDELPFVTDGGHYILDCAPQGIGSPRELALALKAITGVVDHGLFVGMATMALTVDAEGAITEHHARRDN